MSSVLFIRLLGSFYLTFQNQQNGDVGEELDTSAVQINSPRLQSLLAYLLLHQGPQSRQQLAYLFWPDSTDKQARTNLRGLLHQLRQRLPDAKLFITYDTETIQWNQTAPYACDLLELRQHLARIEQNPLDEASLMQVVELYRGELLPSCYDDWIAPLRRELHEAVKQTMKQLLILLERRQETERSIQLAQRLLTLDPLDEEVNRRLIQSYALTQNRTNALRHYQTYVDLLRRELDVPPDEQIQQLYQQILNRTFAATRPPTPSSGASLGASPFAVDQLPLVGRNAEWKTARRCWQTSLHGHPQLLLITGVAGIGKTRLAEELWHRADEQGALVARSRAYAAHGAMTYGPITDLLRTPMLYKSITQLERQWLIPLVRILPELYTTDPDLPPPESMAEGWQRQQFQDALVQATVAHQQPCLYLLDDLQWCELETLLWIEQLLHNDGNRRLLVVGTARLDEVGRQHPLTDLLLRLQRKELVTEIALMPLNEAETVTLAQQVTSRAADPVDAEQLFADTAGNPLFVVETVRAQVNQPAASTSNGTETGMPPKVYAVIKARLVQLSSNAQRMINLAAVIGRSFTFAILQEAGSVNEEMLLDTLDELRQRHIIREQAVERYDFSHDRIRDVAYAEISQTRRRLLHRRVAEAIELVHADQVDEQSGVLAEHFEQVGNLPKAIHYLQQAGAWSVLQFADNAAIAYFSRALTLVPATDLPKRMELLLAREQILGAQGRVDAQGEDLHTLRKLLTATDAPSPLQTNHRALIYSRWSNWYVSRGDYEEALAMGQQAIQQAQASGDAAIESKAYHQCAFANSVQGKIAEAHPLFEQALAKARIAGDRRLEADALEWLAPTEFHTGGRYGDAVGDLEEAMSIHKQRNDLSGQIEIYNKLAYIAILQGEDEFDVTEAYLTAGIELCRQLGHPIRESQLLRNWGWLYSYIGKYEQAHQTLQQALALAKGKDAGFEATTWSYIGLTYLQSGDIAQAKRYLESYLEEYDVVRKTKSHRVFALQGMSLLHTYTHAYDVALHYAQEAMQNAESRGDSRHAAIAWTCKGHAQLGMAEVAEAQASYSNAYRLHLEMEQSNRSMEPLAGLAEVALCTENLEQASAYTEQILAHIEKHTLARTTESCHLLLSCHRVLTKLTDPRAAWVRQQAQAQLQSRADSLRDEAAQRIFWTVPAHQAMKKM